MERLELNINGQKCWMDFEAFEAQRKWTRERERELIPSYLWGIFGLLEPTEQNMNIKDNFGADKKDQNSKREGYMNSIEADHGPRKVTNLSWFSDAHTRERAFYIDEYGNGKTFYMSPVMLYILKSHLEAGNKIEDVNFRFYLNSKEELMLLLNHYKTEHRIKAFE